MAGDLPNMRKAQSSQHCTETKPFKRSNLLKVIEQLQSQDLNLSWPTPKPMFLATWSAEMCGAEMCGPAEGQEPRGHVDHDTVNVKVCVISSGCLDEAQ